MSKDGIKRAHIYTPTRVSSCFFEGVLTVSQSVCFVFNKHMLKAFLVDGTLAAGFEYSRLSHRILFEKAALEPD